MLSIKEILAEKYKHLQKDIVLDGADLISQEGYTLVPNFVLRTRRVSGRAKLVYALLLSRAWGDKDTAFPGQQRLAEECGSSPRSVWAAIKELEEQGFLTVIRRGLGRTNLYILHLKKLSTMED